MAVPYEYSPFIWLLLGPAACLTVLGLYAFQRRATPGAVPFVAMAAVVILWIVVHALQLTATVGNHKAFWYKFEAPLLLLAMSAALCFAIEYAGLGKWLTRRTLVLLTVVPVVLVLLILTNRVHNLVWLRNGVDRYVHADYGPVIWVVVVYGYLLNLLILVVFGALFLRSPRHRWIVGALILTSLLVAATKACILVGWNPVAPFDSMLLAGYFGVLLCALAFFRFHIFDVVPVASETIIEGMPDGVMVVDAGNRLVDLNDTAQNLLRVARSKAIGSPVSQVLHAYPKLLGIILRPGATQGELSFGETDTRWVQVVLSPLMDQRGFHLGRLIWLHDVTARKRAQEQFLDQERTLAMLKERELLARELHDGIGQMLAAAHLQARSGSELLSRGETAKVALCLDKIAEVTQEAKECIRTYLVGVKSRVLTDRGFLPTLRQYLERIQLDYGLSAELTVSPELEGKQIGTFVEAQLQPIIQEALTNVRRHGGVDSARVILASSEGQVEVTIEDQGRGFDPAELGKDRGFGIRSMQGRAEAVGGIFNLSSAHGKGTRVSIRVPWAKEQP